MNFRSPEWLEVVSFIEQRLAELDKKNRNPTLTWEETLVLRGSFKELNWLLDAPGRVPLPPEPEQNHSL